MVFIFKCYTWIMKGILSYPSCSLMCKFSDKNDVVIKEYELYPGHRDITSTGPCSSDWSDYHAVNYSVSNCIISVKFCQLAAFDWSVTLKGWSKPVEYAAKMCFSKKRKELKEGMLHQRNLK